MERTNITVEAKLHELRDVAASWRSHANEWTMPLASYDMILSDLQKRCDRERKAAFDVLVAARKMIQETANKGGVSYPCRWELGEKLYVYARVMGEIDYSHAVEEFTRHGGTLMFKHTDEAYDGEVVTMTLKELLGYINADHSAHFEDYNAEDWGEGMSEWTDLEIVKW